MKKQVITGWAYPCDAPIFKYNISGQLCFDDDKYPCASEDTLKENQNECICGFNCKPIKIVITVEPVEENHENK